MNGMYYDRYIRHCSSRRPPHISPTAPPLKRRCGTRILSNPVVLYLFRYCCFFAFQHSSPSVHPIRSLYLLAALFDFISFIYLFYKRNCNDHFAPYCTCPEYYHLIVCLLGRIPLYFSTFLRTAWLQRISVLPFEHEYSCILSYILPFTAIYSGIKEQSEAIRVDGRREAVYAA